MIGRFTRWLGIQSQRLGNSGAVLVDVGSQPPQRANRVEIATLFLSLASFMTLGLTQCQLNRVQTRVAAAEAESTVQYSYRTITIFDFCSPEGSSISENLEENTANYKENQAYSLVNGYVRNDVWRAFQVYLEKTCPTLDATTETKTPHTLAFIQVQNKNAAWSPRIVLSATAVRRQGSTGIWKYSEFEGDPEEVYLGQLDSTDIIRVPVAFLDSKGIPAGDVLVPRKLAWASRLDGRAMSIDLDFIKDPKSWRGFSPRMGVVGK